MNLVGFTIHPGIDPVLFSKVGLRDGDELIRINGTDTDTTANLWRALQDANDSTSVTLSVVRDEKIKQLSFTLSE
jgi:type II secretory pathway component PulC